MCRACAGPASPPHTPGRRAGWSRSSSARPTPTAAPSSSSAPVRAARVRVRGRADAGARERDEEENLSRLAPFRAGFSTLLSRKGPLSTPTLPALYPTHPSRAEDCAGDIAGLCLGRGGPGGGRVGGWVGVSTYKDMYCAYNTSICEFSGRERQDQGGDTSYGRSGPWIGGGDEADLPRSRRLFRVSRASPPFRVECRWGSASIAAGRAAPGCAGGEWVTQLRTDNALPVVIPDTVCVCMCACACARVRVYVCIRARARRGRGGDEADCGQVGDARHSRRHRLPHRR